jgi:hypothetical protein
MELRGIEQELRQISKVWVSFKVEARIHWALEDLISSLIPFLLTNEQSKEIMKRIQVRKRQNG